MSLHPATSLALHFKRFLDASPSITGAWVMSGETLPKRVLVRRSHKDPTFGIARRTLQSYVVIQGATKSNQAFIAGGPPVPLATNVVHVCPSPSGKLIAYLKDGEEGKSSHPGAKAKAVCELYDAASGALLREVVSEGLHGALVQDGFLSEGLTWSKCERFVGYVAEGLAPHTTCDKSFFHPLLPSTVAAKGAAVVGSVAGSSSATAAAAAAGASTPLNPAYLQEGLTQGKGASWEGGGREDWGEKYVGVRATKPFVVDFERGVVCSVPVPDGVSAGQPIFIPTEAGGVLYTGWGETGERRLGLIHCFNRPHALFSANWGEASASSTTPSEARQLTPYSLPSRSPRFSPSGSHVAFLTMPSPITRMTHNGPSKLCVATTIELLSGDLGAAAELGAELEGTEVNTPTLPSDPWYKMSAEGGGGEEGLLCPTALGIQGVVLRKVVTTGNGTLPPTPSLFNLERHFTNELGVTGLASDVRYWGKDLFSISNPICMDRLEMAGVERAINCGGIKPSVHREWAPSPVGQGWVHSVKLGELPTRDAGLKEERALVARALGSIFYETLTVYPSRSSAGAAAATATVATMPPAPFLHPSSDLAEEAPFHCTLLYPTGTTKEAPIPLIVVPHGGPHSSFTSAFSPHYAALASLGYGVLLVNYRGSTGYPLATLASLPGRCGVADVSDVFQATLTALASCGWEGAREGGLLDSRNARCERDARVLQQQPPPLPFLDGSRVGLCGGSHGGFLAAHLISNPATRPLYRTAVLRNPVTNIASMVGTTDIPDWCAVEALGCEWGGGEGGGSSPPSEGFDGEALKRMYEVSPAALTRFLLPCAPTNPLWGSGGAGAAATTNNSPTLLTATDLIAAGLIAPEKGGVGFPLGERAARVANLTTPVHSHPTPFMVMLGMKDRRVPPSQGMEWYHSVRRGYREGAGKGGRGGGNPSCNDVQLLIYPEDTHALEGGLTDGDAWVHLGCWLEDKVKGV